MTASAGIEFLSIYSDVTNQLISGTPLPPSLVESLG
jgi:hypothetical protein